MTRLLFVWTSCAVLLLGSFGVLLLEDQRLGIPLPYSIALAFASLTALATLLLTVFERIRANRPIEVRETPAPVVVAPPIAESAAVKPRVTAQGVVLLDATTIPVTTEAVV